jgi:hypothetical protein
LSHHFLSPIVPNISPITSICKLIFHRNVTAITQFFDRVLGSLAGACLLATDPISQVGSPSALRNKDRYSSLQGATIGSWRCCAVSPRGSEKPLKIRSFFVSLEGKKKRSEPRGIQGMMRMYHQSYGILYAANLRTSIARSCSAMVRRGVM